ncbi:hypothetical protein GFGA_1c0920 [Gluconobacter frateurii NBRC 103465]|nr:hypothetical protein GFGA_1c0920 [Gluconobacter frateurii NBRC 103465]
MSLISVPPHSSLRQSLIWRLLKPIVFHILILRSSILPIDSSAVLVIARIGDMQPEDGSFRASLDAPYPSARSCRVSASITCNANTFDGCTTPIPLRRHSFGNGAFNCRPRVPSLRSQLFRLEAANNRPVFEVAMVATRIVCGFDGCSICEPRMRLACLAISNYPK